MGDTGDTKISEPEKYRALFWGKIQKKLQICIPPNIKIILKYTRFDNFLSFRTIDDNIINSLQTFVKTKLSKKLEKESHEYEIVFEDCASSPQDFEFALGDLVLLKNLVAFTQEHPLSYWTDDGESGASPIPKNSNSAPTDLNTHSRAEMKKLKRQINMMATRDDPAMDEDTKTLLRKNIVIDVILKSENQSATFEATIKCPFSTCSQDTFVTRDARTKSRWSLSNFKRHVTKHFTRKRTLSNLSTSGINKRSRNQ